MGPPAADSLVARARLALSAEDAGRHVVRHDARSADGAGARRGRRRHRGLGRDLVQLPGRRRRASRAARARRAGAARHEPCVRQRRRRHSTIPDGGQTAVLALQSGEPGPFAQAIAGVDIALWDLQARRAQQPLWRLLGGIDAARSRLCERTQSRPPRRPRRDAAQRRLPRVQAEDRLRQGARSRQRRRAAQCARRRRRLDGRREPGVVARHGDRHGARARAVLHRLARGAAARRSAVVRMAGVARATRAFRSPPAKTSRATRDSMRRWPRTC